MKGTCIGKSKHGCRQSSVSNDHGSLELIAYKLINYVCSIFQSCTLVSTHINMHQKKKTCNKWRTLHEIFSKYMLKLTNKRNINKLWLKQLLTHWQHTVPFLWCCERNAHEMQLAQVPTLAPRRLWSVAGILKYLRRGSGWRMPKFGSWARSLYDATLPCKSTLLHL